ncbi:MAG: hypothetical protein ACRDFX_06885 [Chloroflexota bacterium]
MLDYLKALTFDFERDGESASAVLIYATPDEDTPGAYRAITAADTGFEGIACVDDTARAVLLALGVYERSETRPALTLARRWLSFVEYMQYPDGSFANFIRNASGVRNATGETSQKGGLWWSSRALWALARAYRITGSQHYLERYHACTLEEVPDGKINGVLALAALELFSADGDQQWKQRALHHCDLIIETTGDAPYLLDHPHSNRVNLWGYHQLHALAAASELLDRRDYLKPCRRTIQNLIEPDIRALMWHAFPSEQKDGVTAYDVAPLVLALGTMCRATGAQRYRQLALRAAAWFYGRNDARTKMYDPTTGRCRDGINAGVASLNCGAESAIEAGLAELERRDLLDE